MRKTILLLFVAVLPLIASAQREEVKIKVVEKEGSWRGFVTNRFWDNWFISIGGGGQVYFGEHNHHNRFWNRVTPAYDFSVGKWLVPTFGIRAQIGGVKLKGITDEPDNIMISGVDSRGWYKQSWKQFNVHVDGLVNLSNWIGGYRTDRFYEIVPFAGFGMIHQCSSTDNTKFMFAGGIINKFRISNSFDFNLEMNGHLVPQAFDGETGDSKGEGFLSVTVGFTYKFNERFFRREKPTEVIFTGVSPEMLTAAEARLAEEIRRADRLQGELNEVRGALRQEQVIVKETKCPPLAVFFQLDKSNVTTREMINIKAYAEIIKNNPDKKYKVYGYADKATGNAPYNLKLSERRARNVADILIKKYGVNPDQLEVSGKGGVSGLFGGEDIKLNRVVIVENQ